MSFHNLSCTMECKSYSVWSLLHSCGDRLWDMLSSSKSFVSYSLLYCEGIRKTSRRRRATLVCLMRFFIAETSGRLPEDFRKTFVSCKSCAFFWQKHISRNHFFDFGKKSDPSILIMTRPLAVINPLCLSMCLQNGQKKSGVNPLCRMVFRNSC